MSGRHVSLPIDNMGTCADGGVPQRIVEGKKGWNDTPLMKDAEYKRENRVEYNPRGL